MSNLPFVLNAVSALAALGAAVFWYLSASGRMPTPVAYSNYTPESDPFWKALRRSANFNRTAAAFAFVSALTFALGAVPQLSAIVLHTPVVVQSVSPSPTLSNPKAPSWTDIVTALSTFALYVMTGLLVCVAVIAGGIGYQQLNEFKSTERLKRTTALMQRYLSPMGEFWSPHMSSIFLDSLPPPDKSTTPDTVNDRRLGASYMVLANYFDEVNDEYNMKFIDQDYYIMRHAKVVREGIRLLKAFENIVTPDNRHDTLVLHLEAMIKDVTFTD